MSISIKTKKAISSYISENSKKIASSFAWEQTKMTGSKTDSDEFEIISKELGIKEIYYTTSIPNLQQFLSKNKDNFQLIDTTIDKNKVYLGEYFPSSENFAVVLTSDKRNSLIALPKGQIKAFEEFYKNNK